MATFNPLTGVSFDDTMEIPTYEEMMKPYESYKAQYDKDEAAAVETQAAMAQYLPYIGTEGEAYDAYQKMQNRINRYSSYIGTPAYMLHRDEYMKLAKDYAEQNAMFKNALEGYNQSEKEVRALMAKDPTNFTRLYHIDENGNVAYDDNHSLNNHWGNKQVYAASVSGTDVMNLGKETGQSFSRRSEEVKGYGGIKKALNEFGQIVTFQSRSSREGVPNVITIDMIMNPDAHKKEWAAFEANDHVGQYSWWIKNLKNGELGEQMRRDLMQSKDNNGVSAFDKMTQKDQKALIEKYLAGVYKGLDYKEDNQYQEQGHTPPQGSEKKEENVQVKSQKTYGSINHQDDNTEQSEFIEPADMNGEIWTPEAYAAKQRIDEVRNFLTPKVMQAIADGKYLGGGLSTITTNAIIDSLQLGSDNKIKGTKSILVDKTNDTYTQLYKIANDSQKKALDNAIANLEGIQKFRQVGTTADAYGHYSITSTITNEYTNAVKEVNDVINKILKGKSPMEMSSVLDQDSIDRAIGIMIDDAEDWWSDSLHVNTAPFERAYKWFFGYNGTPLTPKEEEKLRSITNENQWNKDLKTLKEGKEKAQRMRKQSSNMPGTSQLEQANFTQEYNRMASDVNEFADDIARDQSFQISENSTNDTYKNLFSNIELTKKDVNGIDIDKAANSRNHIGIWINDDGKTKAVTEDNFRDLLDVGNETTWDSIKGKITSMRFDPFSPTGLTAIINGKKLYIRTNENIISDAAQMIRDIWVHQRNLGYTNDKDFGDLTPEQYDFIVNELTKENSNYTTLISNMNNFAKDHKDAIQTIGTANNRMYTFRVKDANGNIRDIISIPIVNGVPSMGGYSMLNNKENKFVGLSDTFNRIATDYMKRLVTNSNTNVSRTVKTVD